MKTKNLVFIGIVVAVGFLVLKPKLNRPKQPKTLRMQLVANVNSPSNAPVYFRCPAEGETWFVFAQGGDKTRAFSGTLIVGTNGGIVCQEAFSSDDLKPCDWLYQKGAPNINSFVLNYSNSPNSTGSWPLKPEQTYSAAISIQPTNADLISLWLCWFGK